MLSKKEKFDKFIENASKNVEDYELRSYIEKQKKFYMSDDPESYRLYDR
tara:strand:+ start:272 stop:418 length:147 start_codon:yes stop_codon:yes gene_type:complete